MIKEEKGVHIQSSEGFINTEEEPFEEAEEPLLYELEQCGLRLSEPEQDKLKIESYLSTKELRQWNKLSSYKKKQVLKNLSNSSEYKKFIKRLEAEQQLKTLPESKRKSNPVIKREVQNAYVSDEKYDAERDASGNALTGKTDSFTQLKADSLRESNSSRASRQMAESTSGMVSAAATGGASEAVKLGEKAAKKFASDIKKSIQQQQETSAHDNEDHGSNIAVSKQSMGIFQKVAAVFAAVISVLASAVSMTIFPIIIAVVVVIVVVVLITFLISSIFTLSSGITNFFSGTLNLSSATMMYAEEVTAAAAEYEIEKYVPYLLAIIEVESHGEGEDVMQSSESAGLAPNSLSPSESIKQGVKYFSQCLTASEEKGCDLETAIQSYNYGTGFIDYVSENGNVYTYELAEAYAKDKSEGVTTDYANEIAVAINGGWRYLYGNMFYVKLIKQYVILYENETVQKVIEEALKHQGAAYVYGGASPETGFDCSGLTQWCYAQAGITLPRTAQQQYDFSTHISMEDAKPGDLIFFTETTVSDNYITHVGIYFGNGKIFEAGDPLGIYDMTNEWHQSHYVTCGRVIESLNDDETSDAETETESNE